MNGRPSDPMEGDIKDAFRNLDERLKRVERALNLEAEEVPEKVVPEEPKVVFREVSAGDESEQESLEFEVGQTWFALIGIVALAIGMAFLLSLPFSSLPTWLPSVGGYVVTLLIFYVARLSKDSFEVISKYLRGSGMLLLFFATLRLYYFGERTLLEPTSLTGQAIFLVTFVINMALAWHRVSSTLWILAMMIGCGAALAVGTSLFMVVMLTIVGASSVYAQMRMNWRTLTPAVFSMLAISYGIWAIGNPIAGNALGIVKDSYAVVLCLPLWIVLFSYPVLYRQEKEFEDSNVQISTLLICGLGFWVFFLHHFLGYDNRLVVSHIILAIILIGIALVFWIREKSHFSTFVYAMTGYLSLSMALLKGFDSPELFVALSVQSLLVIATAIYFCSKFIIVANSLIFIGIILGYIAVSEVEQGMSIGFGIVALISARILNWQKKRLALETEFMRNTYLIITFIVLPYALYYLAPDKFIAVAWLGLSLFYYALFLSLGNRKYRWMGHSTLLLTTLYVVLIGTAKLESHYRIITFLALGSIMIIVSLIFSHIRGKQSKKVEKDES